MRAVFESDPSVDSEADGRRETGVISSEGMTAVFDADSAETTQLCMETLVPGKQEDEQKRLFFLEAFKMKMALGDKPCCRNVLALDLYTRARKEGVPVDRWAP